MTALGNSLMCNIHQRIFIGSTLNVNTPFSFACSVMSLPSLLLLALYHAVAGTRFSEDVAGIGCCVAQLVSEPLNNLAH